MSELKDLIKEAYSHYFKENESNTIDWIWKNVRWNWDDYNSSWNLSDYKSSKMQKVVFDPSYVKNIYVDELKKIVVVVFYNDEKEVVKCSENDEFDVSVGVAIGIARHLFGNHTRFYRHVVEKKTHYVKKKETKEDVHGYNAYCEWCKKNHKRLVSEVTFKKNRNKYLAKMKGEN